MPKITHLALVDEVAPALENGRVPPLRVSNLARRAREYVTPDEAQQVIRAAGRRGRYGHRDATLILLAYRHGLRVGELVALRWEQLDLRAGLLHVNRLKGGLPSVHPLRGVEIRALRRLQREQQPPSPYVLTTERQGPLTTSTVRKIVDQAGRLAGLPFPLHPHALRHGCGFRLANEGHDTRSIQAYLGHASISNTVKYTALSAGRFKGFFRD
jgi:type 1 fimbriae regulatory protein FimE